VGLPDSSRRESMIEPKPCLLDHSLCPPKEREAIGVRFTPGDDLDHNAPPVSVGMVFENFPGFNECKVAVHLCLKRVLVGSGIGPFEMIRNGQHNCPGWIDAHDVNSVWIIDGHERRIEASRRVLHLAQSGVS
jgi:hypothetical protein